MRIFVREETAGANLLDEVKDEAELNVRFLA